MTSVKKTCIVPLFVELSSIGQDKVPRFAVPCSISPTTTVVDQTQGEIIPHRAIFKNNFLTGYSITGPLDYGSETTKVSSPLGGRLAIKNAVLVRVLANENVNLKDIPLKIGFCHSDVMLLSEAMLQSDLMDVQVETEAALDSPSELEPGQVYCIAQSSSKDPDVENWPLRYMGKVGTGRDKRNLFYHTNGWLVQCEESVRFRIAADRAAHVREFPSVRRAALAVEAFGLAADAAWYQDETFTPTEELVSQFTDEEISHLYGSLLLEGTLGVLTTGLQHLRSLEFCFGRKNVVQLKALAYQGYSTSLSPLLGPGVRHGRTHNTIHTKECTPSVQLSSPMYEQLQQFKDAMAWLLSLTVAGIDGRPPQEASKLSTVHSFRSKPAHLCSTSRKRNDKGNAKRLVADDLFWKNVR